MTRAKDVALAAKTKSGLDRMRKNLNSKGGIAKRRKAARDHFQSRNRPTNKTFQAIRDLLRQSTFSGRCSYCEDSNGERIDHFKPVNVFPSETYDFGNYVASCATCNEWKGGEYRSFADSVSTTVTTYVNGSNMPKGQPLLVNPRTEEGLDLLAMDLTRGTDYFEIHAPGTREYLRAKETLDKLRLNSRPSVPDHRFEAYVQYQIQLKNYIDHKQAGASTTELDRLRDILLASSHRSVWRQMQRAPNSTTELATMFGAAPEALTWD